MTIRRIVSGGQTGADRGALDAAIAAGVPHGGWCPKGRRAQDGPLPSRYQLSETESPEYRVRTERNVIDSDGTVIFTRGKLTGGSALTLTLARSHSRPALHVDLALVDEAAAAEKVGKWASEHGVHTLNVAGSRESHADGLQAAVTRVVGALLEPGR